MDARQCAAALTGQSLAEAQARIQVLEARLASVQEEQTAALRWTRRLLELKARYPRLVWLARRLIGWQRGTTANAPVAEPQRLGRSRWHGAAQMPPKSHSTRRLRSWFGSTRVSDRPHERTSAVELREP
jgi:hypothetical protein